MLPEAHLTHQIDGRVRFQIASQRGNAAFFEEVEAKLARFGPVTTLKTNPLTGSVLVIHHTSSADIARFAEENGLFRLVDESLASAPLTVAVAETARQLNQRLQTMSRGNLDLSSLVFLGFVTAGVIRLARGAVWPPGLTLLWYAADLVSRAEAPLIQPSDPYQ
jgi:hypothetical protein